MTYALNTEPYVLPYQDLENLPNARNLVGINGLNVLDSGPGQALTITPYGSLLDLNNLNSTGFVYSTGGTLSTALLGDSATNTVSQAGSTLSVNSVPNSSLQLTTFAANNGSFSQNASSLLVNVGAGLTLTPSYNSGTVTYLISGADLAPGNANFIISSDNAFLPYAQSLGDISSGLLKNTVSTGYGTLSTAVPGVDYALPNANLTNLASISPILGRLITGSGSAWVNLDVGPANTFLQSNGTACFWGSASSSSAQINEPYLTWTAPNSLTNAQNLGSLSTGLLKNTVSGGVASLSQAVNGTDYYGPGVQVAIADGGTGQSTASAAFTALSPLVNTGDLITLMAGVATNLPIGVNGQVLTAVSGAPAWANLPASPSSTVQYVVGTADASVPNAQSLGTLTTGLLKNTVTSSTGVLSQAIQGTDYYGPGSTIPISAGGTGQTTKTAAFNALSPMTDPGDLIYGGLEGTGLNLSIGSNGTVLSVVNGLPTWTIPSGVVPFTVLGSGATSMTIAAQTGYVPTNTSTPVVFTLPTTMAAGSVFRIAGFGSAGWQVAQNTGQQIFFGNQQTTLSTGSLASSNAKDCVEVVCVVANTTFLVVSSIGNITLN